MGLKWILLKKMTTVETYMGLVGLGLFLWSNVASMMSFRAALPTTLASCGKHTHTITQIHTHTHNHRHTHIKKFN